VKYSVGMKLTVAVIKRILIKHSAFQTVSYSRIDSGTFQTHAGMTAMSEDL